MPFPLTQSAQCGADGKATTTTHAFADSVIEDDGLALRRAGAAVICVSGVVALLGFTMLTLAYETWSGYVVQAVAAMFIGGVGMAGGWTLLRHGDRLGPRLRTFPRLGRPVSFAPEPPRPGVRVWVRSEPIAALPAGPRHHAR